MASEISNKTLIINTLEYPAYSIAMASRLVGISKGRIARYLKGYDYQYSSNHKTINRHQIPVVQQSRRGSTYASFLDLIDLLFVKELMKRGFSLQFLRKALDEAKKYLGSGHFARSEFYTTEKEILLRIPSNGNLIMLLRGGQFVLSDVIELFSDKLDFEDITEFGLAKRWYPNGKNGLIMLDPQISFGRPTLIGRSVATNNIYDLYLGEDNNIETVSKWFNIPAREITAAVHFEHSLCA